VKCYKIILLFFFVSSLCWSQVELNLSNTSKKRVSPGDVITGTLLINLNVTSVDVKKNVVKKIKNKQITSFLYLQDVETKGDYLAATLIVTKEKSDFKSIKYKEQEIIVNHDLKFHSIDLNDQGEAIVLNVRNVTQSWQNYKTYYFALLIFCILFFIIYIYLKKKKRKDKFLLSQNNIINKISSSVDRHLIEDLYPIMKNTVYIEFDRKIFLKFESTLNKIQYKKNWTEDEFSELLEIFKKLRESIKRTKWNSKIHT